LGQVEVTVIGSQLRRAGAVAVAASVLTFVLVPTASAGNTRSVFVGSTADGALTSTTVSAGEGTSFVVTIANTGKQTLNHITAFVGRDDNPAVEANPQTAITPTAPVAFPNGTSATAAGCTGGTNAPLTCAIGTLKKGASWTTTVVVGSTTGVNAAAFPIKAVAFVKEGGNDNGANKDTFAAEGTITYLPFSCASVTAYRAVGSRIVTTPCAVTGNEKQQSSVVLPDGLTTITLSEGPDGTPCPAGYYATCIGDPVDARIDGDSTGDVVRWTVTYNVKNIKVRLDKLRVIHYTDAGVIDPVGGFSLKNNACASGSSINCGTAVLSADCKTLTITIQTAGNGKTRLLG
jgi:hypothetical protein